MDKRRNPGRGSGPATAGGRLVTAFVCALAGFMIMVSALAARGEDLRADRAADLRNTVAAQIERNEDLRAEIEELRREIDGLSQRTEGRGDVFQLLEAAEMEASAAPVAGPAVRVTLTDAPLDVKPAGVSDDALIVHQQDIQAVVNALWAGGAEALAIQGQRVISTTGVKCVGNSVVLHGIPYAPPYVIEAIGPVEQMESELAASTHLQVYQQYVEAYALGYGQERVGDLELPGFVGSLGIDVSEQLD